LEERGTERKKGMERMGKPLPNKFVVKASFSREENDAFIMINIAL